MVPADSDRVSPAPPYSGVSWNDQDFVYGTLTLYGSFFQMILLSLLFRDADPTTPAMPRHDWFGLFPLRSPLLGESLLFSLPPLT